MSRWSRSAATLACAAALSIYSRPVTRGPLRLEFDGDRLESIREFNPANQRTEQLLEEMLLLPMKEFSLKRRRLEEAIRRLDQRAMELEVDRREKNSLLESHARGHCRSRASNFYRPISARHLVPVFSYLARETLIWFDGADRVEAEGERLRPTRPGTAIERAKEDHRLVPRSRALYLNEHEWRAALQPFSQVHGEALKIMAASERAQETTLTVASYLTTDMRQETALHGKDASLAPLVERIKGWQR